MSDKIKTILGYVFDWRVGVSIFAAIVMFFAPPKVDTIIKSALRLFGLTVYDIEPEKDEQAAFVVKVEK